MQEQDLFQWLLQEELGSDGATCLPAMTPILVILQTLNSTLSTLPTHIPP